jgi:hypothetical protein
VDRDANEVLRRLIELLLEADGIIGSLLDAATQLQEDGTFTPLTSQTRRRKRTATRYTSATAAAPAAQNPPTPPARADAAGVAHIEFDRRGKRVRVIIPGLAPVWMSRQRAALLQALTEAGDSQPSANVSSDGLVPFKTVERLQRRIQELIQTTTPLKPHSIVSSISRLRDKSLHDHEHVWIQTRDSHTSGETTAYRFVMRADGQIIEHPPDDAAGSGAIGPATRGDR